MKKEKDTETFGSLDQLIEAKFGRQPRKNDQHRANYDAIMQRLRKIETLAKSNIGQLMLMVQRKEEWLGCIMGYGGPTSRDYSLVETARLGVLYEPGVTWEVFIRSFINTILTTKQYVWLERFSYNRALEVQNGTIDDKGIAGSLWIDLDKPLECRNPINAFRNPLKLELIAGNQAVLDWFTKNHKILLFRRACRALGVDLQSKSIADAVAKKLQSLAKRIEDLWTESVPLQHRVDAITKAGRHGAGPISLDGVSVTSCETEEDAIFITWGERERLNEIDRDLRACFEEAKEYGGLAQFPIAQHVAIKLNIPLA